MASPFFPTFFAAEVGTLAETPVTFPSLSATIVSIVPSGVFVASVTVPVILSVAVVVVEPSGFFVTVDVPFYRCSKGISRLHRCDKRESLCAALSLGAEHKYRHFQAANKFE